MAKAPKTTLLAIFQCKTVLTVTKLCIRYLDLVIRHNCSSVLSDQHLPITPTSISHIPHLFDQVTTPIQGEKITCSTDGTGTTGDPHAKE